MKSQWQNSAEPIAILNRSAAGITDPVVPVLQDNEIFHQATTMQTKAR